MSKNDYCFMESKHPATFRSNVTGLLKLKIFGETERDCRLKVLREDPEFGEYFVECDDACHGNCDDLYNLIDRYCDPWSMTIQDINDIAKSVIAKMPHAYCIDLVRAGCEKCADRDGIELVMSCAVEWLREVLDEKDEFFVTGPDNFANILHHKCLVKNLTPNIDLENRWWVKTKNEWILCGPYYKLEDEAREKRIEQETLAREKYLNKKKNRFSGSRLKPLEVVNFNKNNFKVLACREGVGGAYYLLSGDKVKIGKSKDIRKRVASLGTGSPYPCYLIAFEIGDPDVLETSAHEKWSTLRVKGEWFDIKDDFLKWLIKTNERLSADN